MCVMSNEQFGQFPVEREVDPRIDATVQAVHQGQNGKHWPCKDKVSFASKYLRKSG